MRQNPLSVLVWAILCLVGIFAIGLLRIRSALADPGSVAGALAAGLLNQGLAIGLVAVLVTAATRATLPPYKRRACHLRLGANELRVFALLALLALFFLPLLTPLAQIGLNAAALGETLLMIVLAAKNLPAASQLLLVSGMLALTALSFVLATATLASAARTMLGLQDGRIEDLRRPR